MDEDRLAKSRLRHNEVPALRKDVIAPSVIRRPVLDSMLADAAVIAKFELEQMRVNGRRLDREEMLRFEKICQIIIKQSRLEMEVERHVESRAAQLDADDLADGISKAVRNALSNYNLNTEAVDNVCGAVLTELGLI